MADIFAAKFVKRIPPEWRYSFGVWFFVRLGLAILGFLVWVWGYVPWKWTFPYYHEIKPILSGIEAPLLGIWQRWDGIHYLRIAKFGYNHEQLTAFFPFYPLLGRLLSRLTGLDELITLSIVSNFSFLLALVLLYRIVEELYSRATAKRVVLCAGLFPTAFFFDALYPQSLALFFTLLCYWAVYKHFWLIATLSGLCMGLTHSTVIPTVVLLGIEVFLFLKEKPEWKNWITLLVPVMPLLGVGIFLSWRVSQGFPSFTAVGEMYWYISTNWPWHSFETVSNMFHIENIWVGWVNMGMFALSLLIIVREFGKMRMSLWLYLTIFIVFMLTVYKKNEPFVSFDRYLLLAFPIYIGIVNLGKSRQWRLVKIGVGVILQVYLSLVFFMWGWVG